MPLQEKRGGAGGISGQPLSLQLCPVAIPKAKAQALPYKKCTMALRDNPLLINIYAEGFVYKWSVPPEVGYQLMDFFVKLQS